MPADDRDYEISPGGIAVRLYRAERDIEKKADKDYVDSIAEEIRSLRKVVLWFMGATAGSAILVSFTLFVTVGTHIH